MTQYLGEIRMVACNFAPAGWLLCDGQHLPISEYTTLYNLIGTTYGGDGEETFALPDFRGRIPIHRNLNHPIGSQGGIEAVTLTVNQIPNHNHVPLAQAGLGTELTPANALWAAGVQATYAPGPATVNLSPSAILPAGGSQPHNNMMPYLCINFIISPFGSFPTPT